MPYVRRTWQNSPSTATPLTATALNNIEDGVEAATEAIADLPNTFVAGNPTLVVTYNSDGTVASTTENGILSTFTYNTDGTVDTVTRAGVTKTFTYDGSGNVTGAS